MLEAADLSQKLKKAEFKRISTALELRLSVLQREAGQLDVPMIVVFDGWEAAGTGSLIKRLVTTLDPRHFNVYSMNPATEEESLRPFLWRFWNQIPAKGQMAIWRRSWYGPAFLENRDTRFGKADWEVVCREINSFERQLTDDGTLIIKFFCHISKDMQRQRFEKMASNPSTAWRVTAEHWESNKKYAQYLAAAEMMLAKTQTESAPWTIVEAHDLRFAAVKVFQTVVISMESRLAAEREGGDVAIKERPPQQEAAFELDLSPTALRQADLNKKITEETYASKLKKYHKRLHNLEHELAVRQIPVLIICEGWDACGKGGTIKRLTREMDPRQYDVIAFAEPDEEEGRHHYLWRFWHKIPRQGRVVIFDGSWYRRLTKDRVEGRCMEEQWRRAFQEINETEEQLTNFGVVLIKLWLHISNDEQLRRFQERQSTPHKQWKITDEDWRNRANWDDYLTAVDEMISRTSTNYAPWSIIEANSKRYARLKTLKTVVDSIEQKL